MHGNGSLQDLNSSQEQVIDPSKESSLTQRISNRGWPLAIWCGEMETWSVRICIWPRINDQRREDKQTHGPRWGTVVPDVQLGSSRFQPAGREAWKPHMARMVTEARKTGRWSMACALAALLGKELPPFRVLEQKICGSMFFVAQ